MRVDGYSDGGPEWCSLCEDWTGMGCTCEEEERKERKSKEQARFDKLRDTMHREMEEYHRERDDAPLDWREGHVG